MKRIIFPLFILAALLALPTGCTKEARKGTVLTQKEINNHNTPPSGDSSEQPGEPEDPEIPTAPDDPADSDERITDGSVYFVRPVALGQKDGSSWNNALDADGLRDLIAQKLGEDGKQDDTEAYKQADKLDGAKFYFCTGKYLLAEDTKKVVKLEWSKYSKQVRLEFYGGYAPRSGGIDRSQRSVSSNISMLTGDTDDNGYAEDGEYEILLLGNQVDLLIDGMTLAYSTRALTVSSGAGEAKATLKNCIVRNNFREGSSAAGVMVQNGTLVAENCQFKDNTAHNGGAIQCNSLRAVVSATSCTFSGNESANCGGVMNHSGGRVTFEQCTFSSNKSNGYGGGAIHANFDTKLGASAFAELTCKNCTFSSNTAARFGGAISMEKAEATLTGCTFNGNNSATNYVGNGGTGGTVAMIAKENAVLHLSGCTFKNNRTQGTGSALYQDRGRSYIDNCKFTDNTANNRACIRLCGVKDTPEQNSLCYMHNCNISDNTMTSNSGWGIAVQLTNAGAFCMNNCTVARNTGGNNSCATINGGGNMILVNSTIADNAVTATLRPENDKIVKLLNTILVNTNNAKPTVDYGGPAEIVSLGSCIVGTVASADGTSQVYTSGSGDKSINTFGALNMTWDSTNYVYKWSGTLDGHTRINSADIGNLVKNALPIRLAASMTLTEEAGEQQVYSISNVGQDFYDWVTGLSATGFTSDVLGSARGSAATCGAYQK